MRLETFSFITIIDFNSVVFLFILHQVLLNSLSYQNSIFPLFSQCFVQQETFIPTRGSYLICIYLEQVQHFSYLALLLVWALLAQLLKDSKLFMGWLNQFTSKQYFSDLYLYFLISLLANLSFYWPDSALP